MNSQSKHKHLSSTARIWLSEEPLPAQIEDATWNSYGVEFSPTRFALDRREAIAHRRVGEGGYAQTERVFKRLLAEPAPDALDAAVPGSPAHRAA
jgi:hypothetical protein